MDQKKIIIVMLAAVLIGILLYSAASPIIWSAKDHDDDNSQDIDSNIIEVVTHDATTISTMLKSPVPGWAQPRRRTPSSSRVTTLVWAVLVTASMRWT